MEENKHYADPWFWLCVQSALNSDFVEQWMRLTGNRMPRNAIEKMIDESSGYGHSVARQFLSDVKSMVYDRVSRPNCNNQEL